MKLSNPLAETTEKGVRNDDELYAQALKEFSNSKYISTAKIQRIMKVSYAKADMLLNRLIADSLASSRIGSYPSVMLRGRFKRLKALQAELLTRMKLLTGQRSDPKEFLD